MFNRKIFTLLCPFTFFQCGNSGDKGSDSGNQQAQRGSGATLNSETNIFSNLISDFEIEMEKLNIEPKDKRDEELKKLMKNTLDKGMEDCFHYIITSAEKFLVNPTCPNKGKTNKKLKSEMDDIKKDWEGKKISEEEAFTNSLDAIFKQYKELIFPENLPLFQQEISKILEQFKGAAYFLKDAKARF